VLNVSGRCDCGEQLISEFSAVGFRRNNRAFYRGLFRGQCVG